MNDPAKVKNMHCIKCRFCGQKGIKRLINETKLKYQKGQRDK